MASISGVTLQDLQNLLDYNYWARDRMLDALDQLTPEQFTREVGGSFKSIRDTAAHMLGAAILQHLINHGTYHRGQVTTLLRQMGVKPPQGTDMIGYYKQRLEVRG